MPPCDILLTEMVFWGGREGDGRFRNNIKLYDIYLPFRFAPPIHVSPI